MEREYFVKYVAGSGCQLQLNTSDDQFSFEANIVYKMATYDDMTRLTLNGDFIEVNKDGTPYVAPTPVPPTPSADIPVSKPKTDMVSKGEAK